MPAPTGTFQISGEVFELTATDSNGDPVTAFSAPLTLTVSYDHTGMTPEQELGQFIAWWDPSAGGGAGEWVPLITQVDTMARTLVTVVDHFSRFAGMVRKPGLKFLYFPLLGGSGK